MFVMKERTRCYRSWLVDNFCIKKFKTDIFVLALIFAHASIRVLLLYDLVKAVCM